MRAVAWVKAHPWSAVYCAVNVAIAMGVVAVAWAAFGWLAGAGMVCVYAAGLAAPGLWSALRHTQE